MHDVSFALLPALCVYPIHVHDNPLPSSLPPSLCQKQQSSATTPGTANEEALATSERIEELQLALRESQSRCVALEDEVRDLKAVLSAARKNANQATRQLTAAQGSADTALQNNEAAAEIKRLRAALSEAETQLENACNDGAGQSQALAELEAECQEMREHLCAELMQAQDVIARLEAEQDRTVSEASARQESTLEQLRKDFEAVVRKSNDAARTTKDLSAALEKEKAEHEHDVLRQQARLQEEEARMWVLVQRAEAAEERGSLVEQQLNDAFRERDSAQDQLANMTALLSAHGAEKDTALDTARRACDSREAEVALLEKALADAKAQAVDSDNKRLQAEAYMKDYRSLRQRLEEASLVALAARSAGSQGAGGTAVEQGKGGSQTEDGKGGQAGAVPAYSLEKKALAGGGGVASTQDSTRSASAFVTAREADADEKGSGAKSRQGFGALADISDSSKTATAAAGLVLSGDSWETA